MRALRLPRPPAFIAALFAVDLALGALAVLGHLGAGWVGLDEIDFVRLGSEANLPAWYSASQLLAVAFVAAAAATRYARYGAPGARWAYAPAVFFALLSLDEGAQVHERIGNWVEQGSGLGSGLVTGPWLFVAVPVYGLLAWLVVRAVWPLLRGRATVLALGAVGFGLFGIAAAGFESLGNLTPPDAVMVRRGLGVFEEVGEMVAATTLLWAAWLLMRAEGVRLFAVQDLSMGDGEAAPTLHVSVPPRARAVR